MGQVVWISGMVSTVAVVWALATSGAEAPDTVTEAHAAAYVEPRIGEPEVVLGSTGSALATAAFGMSALQPETYNGELVVDLIKASPLEDEAKAKLVAYLRAAESGRADLDRVLTDVRVALAVE